MDKNIVKDINIHFLVDSFRKIDIELSDRQVAQFIQYYELLIEKNKVMNLTAITEYEEVVTKHFVDSLLINSVIDLHSVGNIIDVGTGAGFPGIPIKIVYPNVKITLLDSLNKRVNFLKEVVNTIGLTEVECIHGRAEDYGHHHEYREKYDLCVSRAVANLSTLSEYCLPFVKVGGNFIAYKASNIEEEKNSAQNAIKRLGGKVDATYAILLPTTDKIEEKIERNIIVVQKMLMMSKHYPRKSGTPSKEPLC